MLNYYAIDFDVIENNICSLSGNVVKYRDWKNQWYPIKLQLSNY